MAANPPTESSGNAAGGILLVEEYSALGVAITSALRKFAPLHTVRIAHSFAEAEKIAAVMRPELFLLDLDPPPPGNVAFFHRLRTQYPEARVLVIAAGTSPELRAERGTAGAIQFIEKPFELAEFGAAVQALLGPWTTPHSAHFRGTLRDLHLVDIVQLKCLALSSAVIRLETDEGESGAIYFRQGQICHAVAGALSGTAAFEEIANWPDPHVSETDLPADIPVTINLAWPILLLPIVRRLTEARKSSGAAPPESAVTPTGKKLLIIDDTEMLLIFVADSLAIADPTLQIMTASTGAEGIQLAASVRPDLILLDYSLMDTTGDKVCHALLENAATARIPILMMSGHLSELARTAQDYGNVVATLPKPFLSGALTSEVERVLSTGPLPKAPRPPGVGSEPPLAPPVARMESPAARLPNGDGSDERRAAPPSARELPDTPVPSESPTAVAAEPTKSVASEPPISRAPEERPSSRAVRPNVIAHRPPQPGSAETEVTVTLALEVVSMQLTPSFKMEAATLQPCNPVVSVKMNERSEISGVPLENGFRLGAVQLFDDGSVETMRLVPIHQPPQLPAAKNSFAIGSMNLQQTNLHHNLQLTAPENETMRVLLTIQCDLLAVELSVAFEVVAVVLKAQGATVIVHNVPGGTGAPFALEGVELGPSAELRALQVKAVA